MKECWAEGNLRAYHDGELLSAEMERVAAHLAECPHCEALADEVAGRAARWRLSADDRRGCLVKRLSSGSWAVAFPDGMVSVDATEGQARRAAGRWWATGRRVDAFTGAA